MSLFKEGGRTEHHGLLIISCMNYFDVQREREGGQNIMDFEFKSLCFRA